MIVFQNYLPLSEWTDIPDPGAVSGGVVGSSACRIKASSSFHMVRRLAVNRANCCRNPEFNVNTPLASAASDVILTAVFNAMASWGSEDSQAETANTSIICTCWVKACAA